MGRRPGPSSLAGLSEAVILAELRRRTKVVKKLVRARNNAARKLARCEAALKAAGGGGSGSTGRTRPKNSMTLVEAMNKTLAGKTMGVTELAQAVKKFGYTSHAANFRTIVNAALIKHRKVFRKVTRGKYTTA